MAESQPRDNQDRESGSQPCAICKQPIPRGAGYCTHCENYQSHGRRLLAGIDIQSLIALVPIATLAFVFIKDQLVEPAAELQMASLDCAGDRVELAVANVGDRDAVFAGASLQQPGQAAIPLRFAPNAKLDLLVKAGQTHIYRMNATDEQGASLGLGLSRQQPCRFRIQADAVAFEHNAASDQAICACPAN